MVQDVSLRLGNHSSPSPHTPHTPTLPTCYLLLATYYSLLPLPFSVISLIEHPPKCGYNCLGYIDIPLFLKIMNQTTSIFNQKLSIPENIIAQELTGEIVMLDMESESYYSLNSSASRIWQLLTSLENIEASIEQLLQVYLVDEATLSGDVTLLAQELVAEELLIGCDNQAEEINKSNQPQQENQSQAEDT